MSDVDEKRRPWSPEEVTRLMQLWARVGSVALIAIMLKRTPSSVQTRASRCNLPKRVEQSARHRRRWTTEEDHLIDDAILVARQLGYLDIFELSSLVGRSIDTIVNRLVERFGDDNEDIFQLLTAGEARWPLAPEEAPVAKRKSGRGFCLRCEGPFRSEGPGNWICRPCKQRPE